MLSLQLVSGLATANSGTIRVGQGFESQNTSAQTTKQLAEAVGLVFQFPERHFLGDTLLEVSLAICNLDSEGFYIPADDSRLEIYTHILLAAVSLCHKSCKSDIQGGCNNQHLARNVFDGYT